MTVLSKVTRTIDEQGLLDSGDCVLVALSGGPDSVALLHLLYRIRRKTKLTLHAVYINHNIRPGAAKKEEAFCRAFCDKLGVNFHLESADIPTLAKKTRKSVEQAARDFRYDTFAGLAERLEADRIALGHHLDDRIETVMFRIIRGTGKTGLAGIPIKRGKIIRPLFELTKDDILGYLKKHKLSYCVDQSNAGVDYDRNYIRNRLLPEIRLKLNPAVDRALLNLSETAADDEAFLDQYVTPRLRRIMRRTPGGKIQLALDKFNRYDKWLRRRMLRRCLTELSPEGRAPDKAVVERLDHLCRGEGKAVSLPGRIQATVTDSRLVIHRKGAISYRARLVGGKVTRLKTPALNLRMSVNKAGKAGVAKNRRSMRVTIDYDRVHPPLEVRNIRAGDRFRPLGLKGTKKVGDYLTDRKIHPVLRDEVPVVCDADGIIWLVGHEIADRVKIDSSTRKVLKIGVSRRQEP